MVASIEVRLLARLVSQEAAGSAYHPQQARQYRFRTCRCCEIRIDGFRSSSKGKLMRSLHASVSGVNHVLGDVYFSIVEIKQGSVSHWADVRSIGSFIRYWIVDGGLHGFGSLELSMDNLSTFVTHRYDNLIALVDICKEQHSELLSMSQTACQAVIRDQQQNASVV